MDAQKIIKYWKESAERDFNVAKALLKLKHYDSCLFFSHLAIENY